MSSGTPTPLPPAAADPPSPSESERIRSDADQGGHGQVIAAVDLGSNSFHMVVGRLQQGRLSILDRIREMVRLGAGLDDDGRLSAEASERALACLSRFAERLDSLRAGSVRAVGTNTLRKTRDRLDFLTEASRVLGHPIDVISGVEEARLVYLGAAHSLPGDPANRLVVDIGGGSTELIAGSGYTAERLESLYMGCVSVSASFFPEARVTAKRFRMARLAARQELAPVAESFRGAGWERAYGTSGTIRATAKLLVDDDNPSGIITRDGLERLQADVITCGNLNKRRPAGLSEDRAPVYPGGLAIITEAFDALGIESMMAADGALREGLLFDLLGRLTDEDARQRSVQSLQNRFHVDLLQAARVEAVALDFQRQVTPAWGLEGQLSRQLVAWAARLHEIGLDIAHAQHHRHAAYLLRHADLAGFSAGEQLLLSALVGNHRRRLRPELMEGLPSSWSVRAPRLAVLLRLAVVLCRSRSETPLPPITLTASAKSLTLEFPEDWLEAHQLTLADLRQEAKYQASSGLRLRYR